MHKSFILLVVFLSFFSCNKEEIPPEPEVTYPDLVGNYSCSVHHKLTTINGDEIDTVYSDTLVISENTSDLLIKNYAFSLDSLLDSTHADSYYQGWEYLKFKDDSIYFDHASWGNGYQTYYWHSGKKM